MSLGNDRLHSAVVFLFSFVRVFCRLLLNADRCLVAKEMIRRKIGLQLCVVAVVVHVNSVQGLNMFSTFLECRQIVVRCITL